MGILARILRFVWARWADYNSFVALLELFDWKTGLFGVIGGVAMIFFGATNTAWSPQGVVLAALIAAACISIIVIAFRIFAIGRTTPSPVGDQANFLGEVVSTKEQQTELSPQRITLLELLSEAAAKGLVLNRDTVQTFTHSLRQAANEGSVIIWGILKNGRDPISAPSLYVPEKIDASYFKEHTIDAHQGWIHNENRYVSTGVPSGRNEPNLYSNLHVEKESVLAWLDSITK